MAYYRAVQFRTIGFTRHLEEANRIEAVAGVDVLFRRERKLGFFERDRLLADEYEVRLVLSIGDEADRVERHNTLGLRRDPYRGVDDSFVVRTVCPELADILDELGAEHHAVTRAAVYFESRDYEEAIADGLVDDIAARTKGVDELVAEVLTPANPGALSTTFRVIGRVQGPIDVIEELALLIRRSGLVEPDDIRVAYA